MSAELPEQKTLPKIDIPDADVDHAARELGYAVIRGSKIKQLETIGKAIGGHIHIGRAWLMMAQEEAAKMASAIDSMIEDSEDAGQKADALRIKEKVVGAMIVAAKTMIDSGDRETQSGGTGPSRLPGFSPGVPAVPIYPTQINIVTDVSNDPEKRHVTRVNVESKPGRSTGGASARPADERTESHDQRDSGRANADS